MPIAGLPIIVLVGAAVASVFLWDRNATSFGVVTADNYALFVNLVIVAVGILTVVLLVADDRARRPAGGRVLRARAVFDRRHDADGPGDRSPAPVPGARDDVDCGLRADRHPPRSAGEHRGRVQVLPARRVCQLVLPLRHRVHLRRHRQHQPRSRRLGDCGAVDERQPDDPAGGRPAHRRLRVQGGGRAVPHVVARRLRRRARGGDRLHVDGRQGGGDRRVRARVPVGARADDHRLGAGALGASRRRR